MVKKEKSPATKAQRPRRRTDVEVEVKIKTETLDCLVEAGLEAETVRERHFEDNWVYELPDGKLRKGQYLRVRYTGDGDGYGARREGVLTYKGKPRRESGAPKGKDKGKKVKQEIETLIGQPTKMVKILKRLGLRRSFRYQKYRTIYRVKLDEATTLNLMFDETPIGNFIELEGEGEAIETAADRLGFKESEFLTESYVEMQMARCKSRGIPLHDMTFDMDGSANPPKASRKSSKKTTTKSATKSATKAATKAAAKKAATKSVVESPAEPATKSAPKPPRQKRKAEPKTPRPEGAAKAPRGKKKQKAEPAEPKARRTRRKAAAPEA